MNAWKVSDNPRVALALACLGIVVVQVFVLVAGDSRVFSGSDSGGRAAAVAAASENGGCDHDLGYWAADADPKGRAHPMFNTVAVDGRFIQPVTLPYVCLGAPAHRSAGAPWGGLPVSSARQSAPLPQPDRQGLSHQGASLAPQTRRPVLQEQCGRRLIGSKTCCKFYWSFI